MAGLHTGHDDEGGPWVIVSEPWYCGATLKSCTVPKRARDAARQQISRENRGPQGVGSNLPRSCRLPAL